MKNVLLFIFFIAVCGYAEKPRFDNEDEDYKDTKTSSGIFSFGQEGQKFGIRAGLSLYDYSLGVSEMDKYIEMGYGFGVGLVVNVPFTSTLSFVPEVDFLYRKPAIRNEEIDEYGGGEHVYLSEYAISIPAMLKVTPIEGKPFYLVIGVQLDIPFKSEVTVELNGNKIATMDNSEYRASLDFGIPLGFGYLVTTNLDIDLRAVIGITSPSKETGSSRVKDSWNQYGAGLTYYF